MILPLCFLMAAMLPASSTNQVADLTPTPKVTVHRKVKTLAAETAALKSSVDEDENQLMSDLFDPNSPAQQNITPYTTMPVAPHTVNQLEYASRAWFTGPRDDLNQHGVGFSATYTGLFAGNPVGGTHPGGSVYFDNITLSAIIDTEKLFGWHGGNFIMSVQQQDGGWAGHLSQYVGNQFDPAGAAGGYTMKWANLYYQQAFYYDRMNINIGRVAAMDEFDVSPILWNYIGSLAANPTNLQTTWAPNNTWGGRLKINVTHDTELRLGIYQITNLSNVNNLAWNFYPNDTEALFAQWTWNPQFCEAGSTSIFNTTQKDTSVASSKKDTSDKSFKNPVDVSKLQKLPGHYFVGCFDTPQGAAQFGSNTSIGNSYAFYCHGDQMVYRPNPLTDAGLTLWSELAYSPNSERAKLTYQAKGGAIYTGLIPGRRNDFTILGLGWGGFSSSFQSFDESQNLGDPTYEFVSELGYRINLTRFFYVQPDIQFIVNPGGTGHIPDALVLAAQIGVVF